MPRALIIFFVVNSYASSWVLAAAMQWIAGNWSPCPNFAWLLVVSGVITGAEHLSLGYWLVLRPFRPSEGWSVVSASQALFIRPPSSRFVWGAILLFWLNPILALLAWSLWA